jgi:predicted HTH transcriptional regulator
MESGITLVQKLRKKEEDAFSLAKRYYTILSGVNDLHLTEREIQLIAFAAVRGNISYANIRKDFCDMFNTSSATINNIISKLKKVGVLIKDGTKVKVNPVIVLDFNKNISLEIKLTHG